MANDSMKKELVAHGVYVNGEDGNVRCCLQKKPEEELRKAGAVNEAGCVDIDTGALIFSTAMMDSLYSLIGTEEGYEVFMDSLVDVADCKLLWE